MKLFTSFGLSMAIVFAVLVSTDAFVIHKTFTQMCGHNLTLAEPNESLQVDFNVPTGDTFDKANCTSFIVWSGPPEFKLLPFTTRSVNSAIDIDEHPQVVLSITDVKGEVIKLDMYGSQPLYLSITPMQMAQTATQGNVIRKRCPQNYISCGQQVCIHAQFQCDFVQQCATDETNCYEIPSNSFLALSFFGVMFTFAFVSFLLALYVYFKFYRHTVFLLSADYKPQFYGTVNGSFNGSSNSFASLLQGKASSPNEKKSLFYDNIQQHYDTLTGHPK